MLHLTTFAQAYQDPYSMTTTTTTTTSTGQFPWALFFIVYGIGLVLLVISLVAMWKLFKKAGRPGWAAIIPVYGQWVLFELTGFPGWLSLLFFVPFVNFIAAVISIVSLVRFVKLFGKGTGFAVLTVLFPYIMLPILAFGDAQWQGPYGQQGPQGPQGPQDQGGQGGQPLQSGDQSFGAGGYPQQSAGPQVGAFPQQAPQAPQQPQSSDQRPPTQLVQ